MKQLLTLLFFSICYSLILAQTIDYYPTKRASIAQKDYDKGKYFLENTYKQMKENGDVVYADYWNIALAYAYMGESKEEILDLLKKSKEDHPENFCYIANWANKDKPQKENVFHRVLGADYIALLNDCDEKAKESSEKLSLKEPSAYKGYNYNLIKQLHTMKLEDQKYRGKDGFLNSPLLVQKQRTIDTKNEKEIAEMIDQYGYPGSSLVGKEWRDIACVIFVHANSLSLQEQYLPIFAKAADEGELSKGIVRILVDKIQLKKTGKQIFGTQSGIPFEAEWKIRAVEREYKL